MLTSIDQEGAILQLRNRESENLFDIDSVSLVIGPNGCGKSRFLQRTVEKFAPRARPTFDSDCRLAFDYRETFDHKKLNEWGLVYYTPVRNRLTFRKQANFIDASRTKDQNLFQLYERQNILEEFGLRLELFAQFRVDERKIKDFLVKALVEDEKKQYSKLPDHPTVLSIRELENRLKNFSDFNDSKEDLDHMERDLKRQIESLGSEIFFDLRDSAEQSVNNPQNYLLTLYAVIQAMQKMSFDFPEYISLLTKDIPSSFFNTPPTSATREGKIAQCHALFTHTRATLQRFNFKKASRGLYQYPLNVERDRYIFERSELHIFEIVLPGMSSGQWAIINQVISIYEAIKRLTSKPDKANNILVLIDEGDAFLHLAWQRKYIWQINNFLSACKSEFSIPCLQLIIASHSPLLTSDVPREFICSLYLPESDQAQASSGNSPSFAAPLSTILNICFNASTIGEFATRRINSTIEHIKQKQLSPEDEYLISVVDDPIIKRELTRMRERLS